VDAYCTPFSAFEHAPITLWIDLLEFVWKIDSKIDFKITVTLKRLG